MPRPAPTPRPGFRARLRDVQLLIDAMEFSDVDVRKLSELCGDMRHRSTIGHLHSGARNTCEWPLAASIEKRLRVPRHSLFTLVPTTRHVDSVQKMTRKVAA